MFYAFRMSMAVKANNWRANIDRCRLTSDDRYRHFLYLRIRCVSVQTCVFVANILAGYQHRRAVVIVVHCDSDIGMIFVVKPINGLYQRLLSLVICLTPFAPRLCCVRIWCLERGGFQLCGRSRTFDFTIAINDKHRRDDDSTYDACQWRFPLVRRYPARHACG